MFVEFLSDGEPIVVSTNEIVCVGPMGEDNCSYIRTTTASIIVIDWSYENLRDHLFEIDRFVLDKFL